MDLKISTGLIAFEYSSFLFVAVTESEINFIVGNER